MKRALWLLVLSLLLVSLAAVEITQDLSDHKDLSVGDRFQFNIHADVSLKSVTVPDTITNFHVLKVERMPGDKGKSWLRLTLVPLLPGSHSFPRLEVTLDNPDGQTYYTDRFRVNIIPVRAVEDSLLVDIKPLEKYPGQLPVWVYLVLLGLAVFLLLLYVFLRKSKKVLPPKQVPQEIPEHVEPDPAWKQALNEFEEVKQQHLVEQGDFIQHHYHLSQIIRRFMERKYHFTAGEMTTSEIRWVVERIRVERSPEMLQFLRYCDMVKFARYTPALDEVENAEVWLRFWLQSFEVLEAQQRMAGRGREHAEVR